MLQGEMREMQSCEWLKYMHHPLMTESETFEWVMFDQLFEMIVFEENQNIVEQSFQQQVVVMGW